MEGKPGVSVGGAVDQGMDPELQQKQGWGTKAKVRTWQSDGMQQSEGQGRSQPHGSMEGQDKELKVLRAGARSGAEQPRRRIIGATKEPWYSNREQG